MPSRITKYRVFIATPGGLETIRHDFRATIDEYNKLEAVGGEFVVKRRSEFGIVRDNAGAIRRS